MIVSKFPRVGHAWREILIPLTVLFVWDVLVTVIYFKVTPNIRPIELPLSLFGSVIALFIGFCVNAAYARWWEARGLWGLMINASRNVSRAAITMIDDGDAGPGRISREIVRMQIAFVHILRTALRGQAMPPEAATYLTPARLEALGPVTNKANALLTDIAGLAATALKDGKLDRYARVQIESVLVDIANAQGGMERIKNTPMPSQYRFFPPFFAHVFCVVLPFAVVQDLGIYTPAGSTLVGLMFLMAAQIGLDLMNPFSDDIYDVPMTAMCRTIEIDLQNMLGEPAPEKVMPVKNVLW